MFLERADAARREGAPRTAETAARPGPRGVCGPSRPARVPAGTTAARPATRLRPSVEEKYEFEQRERNPRDAGRGPARPAITGRTRPRGASSPGAERARSSATSSPVRNDDANRASMCARMSAAPTVSAAGEPPGTEMLPKPGPRRPVVARGRHDERVEPRPRRRPPERPDPPRSPRTEPRHRSRRLSRRHGRPRRRWDRRPARDRRSADPCASRGRSLPGRPAATPPP